MFTLTLNVFLFIYRSIIFICLSIHLLFSYVYLSTIFFLFLSINYYLLLISICSPTYVKYIFSGWSVSKWIWSKIYYSCTTKETFLLISIIKVNNIFIQIFLFFDEYLDLINIKPYIKNQSSSSTSNK